MPVYQADTTPWQVDATDYPVEAPMYDRARFLLRYAILAPSSHNAQPWRFSIDDQTVRVFADQTRWLRIADEDQRELYASVGCAIENFLVAADHFSLGHQLSLFPDDHDPDLVAEIELSEEPGEPTSQRPPALFEAITERRTNRSAYRDEPVVPRDRKALADLSSDNNVQLRLYDKPDILESLQELMTRADMTQFADPEWRAELADWIGRGVFGTSWLMSKLSRLAVTHFDMGRRASARTAETVRTTPLFGAVTTPTNERVDRVRAGQALERLWLRATLMGLAVHPMNQVLQVPETRQQFTDTVDMTENTPQVVFRLGHADPVRSRTPRRPLTQVLE